MGLKLRPLGNTLGVAKTFSTEDGAHYRGHHQEMAPVFKHVEYLRHKVNEAPKAGNPNEWEHVGSIPMALLVDWLHRTGHTMDQWARNDGGEPNMTVDSYHRDPGVKAQFLRYFFSRDFSKFHNRALTTKRESSQIVVPSKYRPPKLGTPGIVIPPTYRTRGD